MTNFPNDLAEATAEMINNVANEKGEEFAKNVKTNQIRNIFAHINTLRNDYKIEKTSSKNYSKIIRDLILLKPLLAYAAGRQRKVEGFQKFVNDLIDKTKNSKNPEIALENFFLIVEAVVAYHKFHGGEDK